MESDTQQVRSNADRCEHKGAPEFSLDLTCPEVAFERVLEQAHSLPELQHVVRDIVNYLGFSDFLFLRLSREWHALSSFGLLTSLAPDVINEYHLYRLYENDLLLAYAKHNTQPTFSSNIYDYFDDAPFDIGIAQHSRRLRQFYKRHGYFEQWAIPAAAHNGCAKVLLVISSTAMDSHRFRRAIKQKADLLNTLCKVVDIVTTQQFNAVFIGENSRPKILNPKPLAMLKAMATTDATITEIAKQLGVSPITAHQHMTTARRELGVKTNIGAVLKVIKTGLIQLE